MKRDASFNVVAQKFGSVTIGSCVGQFCALLKLVNSGAEVALSLRRGGEISPLFQSGFLVHSLHSFDSSFRVHSGVQYLPHLPTTVVLHSNRQSSCGCFTREHTPSVLCLGLPVSVPVLS